MVSTTYAGTVMALGCLIARQAGVDPGDVRKVVVELEVGKAAMVHITRFPTDQEAKEIGEMIESHFMIVQVDET